MPIENSGGAIIVTGKSIELSRAITVRSALHIEMLTGMRHSRGSVLKVAQRDFGVTAKTKAGAIEQLNKWIEDHQHLARA